MVICLNEYKNLINLKKEKSYSFEEFKSINKQSEKFDYDNENYDINTIDYWIGQLKSDPYLYKKATVYLAIGLQILSIGSSLSFASSTDPLGVKNSFDSIINIFNEIAQYTFLILGVKETIVKILNGGTVKEAVQASLQYAFGFMFLKLYPVIYSKFASIQL